ncbi:hypothetical protein MH117_25380 [Paenibacillus sp. ACRRX]|uniref:hypothetical protein n=1 Tax=unclassified Paenibacillus TaxID=185978 RepID=UPI001EF51A71|nr:MULTISPECIES: hypothetical protein [unclassified Paenibacillus]MCG7410732.1 hypothetical protein [Paenibacillus sp. ACRRX]MDK8184005.1 hypothetical protein [Paenibacillus sp. UMB4589-SE434]
MWEKVFEYSFGFFMDIIRGTYSAEVILYLILLGGCAAGIEIWRAKRREMSVTSFQWIKEGVAAFIGCLVMVGVCAFTYKCLQRAIPSLGIPGVDAAFNVAFFSLVTVGIAFVGIVVLELLNGGSPTRLESNLFWSLFNLAVLVIGAFLLKLIVHLPTMSDYAYLLGGLIIMLLVLVDWMLRKSYRVDVDLT